MKWAYLATAPGQLEAEMWRQMLVDDGIPAMVRPGDTLSFLGVSAYPCRVLVATDQLERARTLLEKQLTPEQDCGDPAS